MVNLSTLPQEETVEERVDTSTTPLGEGYDFTSAVGDAFKATFPFVGAIEHPIESEVQTEDEEELTNFYSNIYPQLDEVTQQSIQSNGGYKNKQQAEAIIARVEDDKEMQQNLYHYGGFAGSIGLQMGASLFNPVDWAIAAATFGTGKLVTSARTINKAMRNYKRTSAIGMGALEGGITGYASEAVRQETQSIYDEDARINTLMFGSVFGGSLGAKGWFDTINNLDPFKQARFMDAMEADTASFNKHMDEVNLNLHQSTGSGGYSGVDLRIDPGYTVGTPTPAVTGGISKYTSPRAFLYSIGLPSVYKTIQKLAPSVDALKDANGNYVKQSKDSAYDIKAQYEGKKGILVNKLMKSYNDYNADIKARGFKPLSETEFSQEMYKARLEYTQQYRYHQAEIDVVKDLIANPVKGTDIDELKAILETLKEKEVIPTYSNPHYEQLNNNFNDYYMFMEEELRRPTINKRITEVRHRLERLGPESNDKEKRDTFVKKLKELTEIESWDPTDSKGYTIRLLEMGSPKNVQRADRIRSILNRLEARSKARDDLGKELVALEDWKPTEYKGYLTRIFDKDKIEATPDVVRKITTALQNSPTSTALEKYLPPKKFDKEMKKLEDVARSIAKNIEGAKNLNQLRDLFGGSGASGQGIVSGGFATGRRIDVDEEELGDLIQTDMSEILDFYHTDISGKLAIRKAFKDDEIDTFTEFKAKYLANISDEYIRAGTSKSDIDRTNASLEVVFDDLRGTRGVMSRPNSWGQNFKKIATSFNNIRFGPNFPLVALNEIGPTLHMGGVKSLSYFNKAVKEAVNKITNKEIGTEFIRELQGMGIGADIQNSKAMLRYTEGSHFFESNKVVNALRKAEHAVFRYGGLIGMTDAMKSMLAGGFTARTGNIAKRLRDGGKVSTTERAMLSRLGLEDDMVIRIADNLDTHATYTDGQLQAFNIDDWDPDVAEAWGRTLHRVTKGNILEPTAMDIPTLMSDPDKPLNGIIFQYYRFPMAAQSQLLSKAINDKDVGALGAMMISSTTTALVEYGKVMAAVKLGELAGIDVHNPYEDITKNEDAQTRLAGKVFSMNPYFGIIPTAYNIAAPAAGLPIAGTDYKPKDIYGQIGGATLGNINTIVQGLANPDRLPYAIYQQAPRIPFLYDLGKSFVKEEF